jgi:hypothetical protein
MMGRQISRDDEIGNRLALMLAIASAVAISVAAVFLSL